MTSLYVKKFLPGNLVKILFYNKSNRGVGIILAGPSQYKTYKILKNSGDIAWISHTCLEDVRIFGWGPNIS